MRTVLIIIMLSITNLVYFSQQKVYSEVNKALVYVNSAQLDRNINVNLQKGENVIWIYNVENSLDKNSIQVFVDESVNVLNIDFNSKDSKEFEFDKNIQSLENREEILIRKIELLNFKKNNLTHEKNMILSNKTVIGDNSGFDIDDLLDLRDVYRNGLNEIDYNILATDDTIRFANDELKIIRNDLSKTHYRKKINIIELKLYTEIAGNKSFGISYIAYGVTWNIMAEAKAKSSINKIDYYTKAQIINNSGVNWKNTNITLSTSNPNYDNLPQIHPWVLNYQNHNIYYNSNAPAKNLAMDVVLMESKTNVDNNNDGYYADYQIQSARNVNFSNQILNNEYELKQKYSIDGISGIALVAIDHKVLDASFVHFAIPKVNTNVYLMAELTDWTKYNFEPANLSLYLDGRFVGNTYMNPYEDKDTLNFVFGKDQNIVAKREKVKDYTKRGISKETREIHIVNSFKNKSNKKITLIIKDQVPISGDKRIEISTNEISNANSNINTGILDWKIILEPNEDKKLDIKYDISYPKNQRPSNL